MSGRVIHGLDGETSGSMVFHAGTRRKNGETVTSGGRVLCVTGWGENIPEALEVAYGRVGRISFEGMQYRRDIGYQALEG